MPPLVAVPNVLKVEVKGTNSSNDWANVLHCKYSSAPPSVGDIGTMVTELVTAWTATMVPLCPPDTVFTGFAVTDLSSDMGAFVEEETSTAGGSTADKLPASTAFLVSYLTARRYRGGHPRTYLYIGADENLQDECNWNDAFVTTVSTAWQAFSETFSQTYGGLVTTGMCAVSYVSKYAPNGGPPRYYRDVPVVYDLDPTEGAVYEKSLATQRRRQRRRR